MPNRVVIDSCIFVSALNAQEKHSQASFNFLQEINQGNYFGIIPATVLIEVVAAIKRRTNSYNLALQAKDFILNLKNLNFIDLDYSRTINMLNFTAQKGLRGMDAIIVWTAKEFNCQLATLDEEVKKLAKAEADLIDI